MTAETLYPQTTAHLYRIFTNSSLDIISHAKDSAHVSDQDIRTSQYHNVTRK
jgi:hypothetical protein